MEQPEEYAQRDVEATEKLFSGMQTIKGLPTGDFREKFETFDNGVFDIQFVGEEKQRRGISIQFSVRDGYGRPLYLVGKDGTNWNWSTIIRVKRVADAQ